MNEFYVQNKEIIMSQLGEDVVMVDVKSGLYFGLNSVAASIWKLMQEKIEFDQIIEKLVDKYEIDKEICVKETRVFIEQMLEKKIIQKLS